MLAKLPSDSLQHYNGPLSQEQVATADSHTSGVDLSEVVLQAIVESGGNTKLVAENLYRQGHIDHPPTTAELAFILKGHLPELKEHMELVSTLELFSTLPQLRQAFLSCLSSLEGSEGVKAYMDLMGLIQKATSKNELNINVHEEVWHRAPVDIKKLFAQLEAAGKLDELDTAVTILEHDPGHQPTGPTATQAAAD